MGIADICTEFFTKGSPFSRGEKPITDDDLKGGYKSNPSIANHLPWMDIVDDNKILLEDGRSVAAVFDITPIPTEARSETHIRAIRNNVARFITSSFEEHSIAPWVVQSYSWLDDSLFRRLPDEMLAHATRAHSMRDVEIDDYSRYFLDTVYRQHVDDMTRPGGMFVDSLNSCPWGGSLRKTYLVFYRRIKDGMRRRKNLSPSVELDIQCGRVFELLRSTGLEGRRLNGEEIYDWLFRWMNPDPKLTKGDKDKWLAQNPYPKPEERVAEWDLAANCASRDCATDDKTLNWYFDGKPHTVISVERMLRVPEVGQLSAERYENREEMSGQNAKTTCFIDELPQGSIMIINYVVKPQTEVKRHLDRLEKNSKGATPEAENTRLEVKQARKQLMNNNKLYPYSMCIALKADDDDKLDDALLTTDTLLAKNNLVAIDPDFDKFRMDRYIRFLPCSFDPSLAQNELRQKVIYTDHLASIFPVYGRSTGTGNHNIVAFNRGGEPFSFDPLLQGDRSKNAHLFMFGPTGAGKSATLTYLQMLITAMYNPRWVVVEAGNSFGLLSEFFRDFAKKDVVDIVLRPGQAPSIAPFKPALDLVDKNGNVKQEHSVVEDVLMGEAELEDADAGDEDDSDDLVQRDILGEMLILARLMVTGAEDKEEEKMSRADLGLLKTGLLNAASEARRNNKSDVLPEDVIRALRTQAEEKPNLATRITEMADAMMLFTDGFAGELFNRPGEELPDADYIRIEMGALASGNDTNDKLSVAYIAIINQVIARAQRTQRDGRPTINLTDEAHVLTTNPLLAKYMVVVSKLLGRRMGLWLWQATQNMEDYKDDAKKMLAMFEWWVCLFVPKGELEHVKRFRSLTEDQEQMLLCTRKQVPFYTEGVVMSDNVQGLFRVIAPGLCFALAMTEKEEKRDRFKLMKEHNITELEAAMMIGERISEKRRNIGLI